MEVIEGEIVEVIEREVRKQSRGIKQFENLRCSTILSEITEAAMLIDVGRKSVVEHLLLIICCWHLFCPAPLAA